MPRPRWGYRTYLPGKFHEHIELLRHQAAIQSKRKSPCTHPVGLEIVIPAGRGDLDNRCKTICDALEGTIYKNDRQIRQLVATLADQATVCQVTVRCLGGRC